MRALLRLSPDITLKAAPTRSRFTRLVAENLRRAWKAEGIEAKLEITYARMYASYEDPRAVPAATRVFGIHSISPCIERSVRCLDDVVAAGVELMIDQVRGRTFAVRARARDPTLGFGSQDVNERLGAALVSAGRVKLEEPEVTVHVEIRDGCAYYFREAIPGESGLPIGAGGHAVVLLSAGFDSAVASHLMMRRGIALDFVCCRLGGDLHEQAVISVANHLMRHWAPGLRARLWVVPFEQSAERLNDRVAGRYRQLVLKRLMYRTAAEIARRTGAEAVVTGEALGQVASQTLRNLRALTDHTDWPVVRPLLTCAKTEILAHARRIGTFDLCSGVPEYCALGAGRPATAASRDAVQAEELLVEFDAASAVEAARLIPLPAEVAVAGPAPCETIDPARRVLDLRMPPARRRAPIDGALVIDPLEVLERGQELDRSEKYAVVCEEGVRSTWFARRLAALGYDVVGLRGGWGGQGA